MTVTASRRDATTVAARRTESAAPPSRGRVWIALVIFAAAFAAYAASPVRLQTDSYWSVFTARSMLRSGDVDLDEYAGPIRRAGAFQIEHHGGHRYYAVPLATSMAALPVVAFASLVDADGLDRALARGATQPYDGLAAALLVALSCAVLYLALARVTARRWTSVAAVAAYAFGTQAWSTASRTMWMHGPSMLGLTVALYCCVRARRERAWFGAAGAALALAFFVRPTNAVAVVVFAVWVWSYGPAAWRRYVVGGGLVAAAMVTVNELLYGQVLQGYFHGNQLSFSSTALEAGLGNLVSPSRGLLVFVPLTLVAGYGALAKFRTGTLNGLDRALLATMAGYWIVVSLFPHWWGGYSYGPRFLADVAPFVVWFLPPAFDAIVGRGARRVGAGAVVALLLLGASVAINARGALDPDTAAWNWTPSDVGLTHARLWNWTDPQFLR